MFPDLLFYHGVASGKQAFRDIILRGALPSDSSRNAGSGLYGVAETNKKDAIEWAKSPDLVIVAPVRENARIVDITKGKGEELFKAFGHKKRP